MISVVSYKCELCDMPYPSSQLFDVKGDLPGGAKVTCLECVGRLEEREECARLAETLPFHGHQMDDGRSGDIARAIRTRSGSRERGSRVSESQQIADAIRQTKIADRPGGDRVDELLRILEEVFPGIVEEFAERLLRQPAAYLRLEVSAGFVEEFVKKARLAGKEEKDDGE